MHSRAHEQELQYGLCDLVALSAFPGLLADDEPAKLAKHLAELLLSTLRLDLAYACVRDQSGGVHEATESVRWSKLRCRKLKGRVRFIC
ncbi:MAG: hypothetical protein K0S79_52 [Nitrospira sp.]|jgi:hypothetical protein|nr:hypothetical protein [Nitrospira sp.]